MAAKTPLEKLEEFLSGTGLVATPDSLTVALALVNGVDAEQMRLDLAEATFLVPKVSPAPLDAIVVKATKEKDAQTVSDIISAASAGFAAEAVLIDAYVRLVIESIIDGD